MNGSTDVRSTKSNPENDRVSLVGGDTARTDTPLPLDRPVEEIVVNSAPRPQPPAGDRIISGIDLIDYGAGGLMPDHVYLVKGPTGIGKSTLGLQFLTRGLEHQEPGILITDQRPERVIAQAKSIGFPIDEPVRRNQLVILNPSSRYFDLVESPADVMAIVDELGDCIRRIGARRLVIDPIFTLINTSYSSHFALSITQSLLNALEDLPATTLLVAGDQDNAELNPILHALEQNAFGVVALSEDSATGGRLMRLTKLRYASTENLSAHYRILNGRGIINYRGDGEHVSDVTQPWEEAPATPRTVLILGARPETIRRVQDALGDQYQVQAESELSSGLERVRREKPALVLVTPSRAAGAVGAILEVAHNSTSSVAFLSPANNRQSDRVLYLRAGADDFIAEPFNPAELRARVEALIRRSGRRLSVRDRSLGTLTPDEITSLMLTPESAPQRKGPVMQNSGERLQFHPDFGDRLQRNLDTVSKFDQPFALYWIKAHEEDAELNRSLAKLCRQEDIVCHNRNGEFVAILPGTDEAGIRGFESRLDEKLGQRLGARKVRRGHSLYRPGDPVQGFELREINET